MAILAIIEAVVAIFGSVISCQNLCCGRTSSSNSDSVSETFIDGRFVDYTNAT